MSSSLEKLQPGNHQWFVFSEDRYRGPLHSDELLLQYAQGEINESAHVWAQGMTDWAQLASVEELISAQTQNDRRSASSAATSAISYPRWTVRKDLDLIAAPLPPPPEASPLLQELPWLNRVGNFLKVWWPPIAVFSLIPLLVVTVHRLYPLPRHLGVSAIEEQELRSALPFWSSATVTAAIALAQADSESPNLLVATNLADGQRLEVLIRGVSGTLAGPFPRPLQATVSVNRHLAKSPVLRQENGRRLPPGEYRVSVVCQSCPSHPTIAEKVYFLGGIKDQRYLLALADYQRELRAKGRYELTEIKQLTETLAQQLSETSSEFEWALRHSNSSGTRWRRFEQRWLFLHDQVMALVSAWTPAVIAEQFVYPNLYSLLKSLTLEIDKIHQAQAKAIASAAASRTAEQQITASSLTAQGLILSLRSKINLVERTSNATQGQSQSSL